MKEISYLEAWQLWFSGQQTSSYLLWGMQILWWGRIGKVIQLISALTILAEIIGAERIRKFGKSLRKDFTILKFWQDFKQVSQEFLQDLSQTRIAGKFDILKLIFFSIKWLPKSAKIILLTLISGSAILQELFINTFIINSMAWILERPYISNLIKVVSVLLLLIGFHFDLLAS
ncbi:hypothetical protein [Calothrix sp. NIES-2098]|uniref:hypothetical protein n=1 Tax=Calothrix sp. NIES-2098 TaxID=1954171 RepID=UPI000BBB81EF